MKKCLVNKISGDTTEILNYIETPKRIKIVPTESCFDETSFKLYKKDDWYIQNNVLIEYENVNDKISKLYDLQIKELENAYKVIENYISMYTIVKIKFIIDSSYTHNELYNRVVLTSNTSDIFVVEIPVYLKLNLLLKMNPDILSNLNLRIEKLFKRNNFKRKDSLGSNGRAITDHIVSDVIKRRTYYKYSIDWINIPEIKKYIPDTLDLKNNIGHNIYLLNESGDEWDIYENDNLKINLTLNEIKKIKPSVKFVNVCRDEYNYSRNNTTTLAYVVRKERVGYLDIECYYKFNDSGEIGSGSLVVPDIKEFYEFANRSDVLELLEINGRFSILVSKDAIIDYFCVKNNKLYFKLNNKKCLINDYLEKYSPETPYFLQCIEKFLGRELTNTWKLISEL